MSGIGFSRTDTSLLARWWWTIDRWLLVATGVLIGLGLVLLMAAGPPAAERIGAEPFHFIRKQFTFVPLAVVVMFAVSMLSPLGLRRLACVGYLGAMVALVLVLMIGPEIKGATRWLALGPIAIQPSEFVKPLFAVVSAWMFAEARAREGFPGRTIATMLFMATAFLIVMQPDIGQTVVLTAIWGAQFFLAGLSLFWVFALAALAVAGAAGAYMVFPHVASRVDRFLDPKTGDTYQIEKAIAAFREGGLFGRGPGEGRVKEYLPDAHTDFIFAVAGEEFGLLLCMLLVALFLFLLLRAMSRLVAQESLFVLLAAGGILVQFGIQAVINMASSLHLMPTKGMTLPFVSYGGSSLLAIALGMGIVLALTRQGAHRGMGQRGMLP